MKTTNGEARIPWNNSTKQHQVGAPQAPSYKDAIQPNLGNNERMPHTELCGFHQQRRSDTDEKRLKRKQNTSKHVSHVQNSGHS